MKIEKFKNKSMSKKKFLLISLGVAVLISVSLLLYRTFAVFNEHVEFPMMNGKVDYFGNSDVYFAFYNGEEKLDTMPEKGNSENLVFDYGTCDNNTFVKWNNDNWGPLVKNLSKSKTKCSLYFKEKTSINICNKYGTDSALCYISKLGDSDYETMTYDHASANGVLDNNLRYVGADPNNYVSFNNEKWRIIGVMKVKNELGVMEERIKIIREDNTEGQEDFGRYSWDNKAIPDNNWVTSTLKERLNGVYLESLGSEFTSMIDKDVIWNIGGCKTSWATTPQIYECERGTDSGINDYFHEWTKENDPEFHKGIALMYASDFGYATSGGNTGKESCNIEILYDGLSTECSTNNWLSKSPLKWWQWTLNYRNDYNDIAFYLQSSSSIDMYQKITQTYNVQPTLYLKSTVKITKNPHPELEYGSIDNPFILG